MGPAGRKLPGQFPHLSLARVMNLGSEEMATVVYPAIIERGKKGYGVFFPDLPGCTSWGATVQDAERNAAEALGAHLFCVAEAGEKIPSASDLDSIESDADVDEVARILVRVET